MQKKQWLHTAVVVMVVRAMTLPAFAQDGVAPAAHSMAATSARYSNGFGHFGFQSQLDKAVGLTPEQKDAVRGLLAQQHKDRVAMQEQTDSKIRAVLNPEQQKKFDAFLAEQKQSRNAARHRAS
jgi:Spy/CpxP family protein refolding chaperone